MRNKVLIVDANPHERHELEQILQEIVDEGGELIFAEKRAEGLALIKKEHPQLVFLDNHLIGENEDEWIEKGVHIVVLREESDLQQKSEDFIVKPLKSHQVLEKCRVALKQASSPPLPPM